MQCNTANVLVEVENITVHMTFRPFVRVGIKISSQTLSTIIYFYLFFQLSVDGNGFKRHPSNSQLICTYVDYDIVRPKILKHSVFANIRIIIECRRK